MNDKIFLTIFGVESCYFHQIFMIEEQSKDISRMGAVAKSLRLRRQRQRRLSSESSDGDCLLDEDKDFDEILRNLRICLEVLHSIRCALFAYFRVKH
jgi:hypothetical protein